MKAKPLIANIRFHWHRSPKSLKRLEWGTLQSTQSGGKLGSDEPHPCDQNEICYVFPVVPTCQVRVVRFYVSASPTSPPPPSSPHLRNRNHLRSVFATRPQPRSSALSDHCRTSTSRKNVWDARKNVRRDQTECQKECYKRCQKDCQEICQKERQKRCQKECQKRRQKECQETCQNECQTECAEEMPEGVPDRMSEETPERMSEEVPERMPEEMPESMSKRVSEDMPEKVPAKTIVTSTLVRVGNGLRQRFTSRQQALQYAQNDKLRNKQNGCWHESNSDGQLWLQVQHSCSYHLQSRRLHVPWKASYYAGSKFKYIKMVLYLLQMVLKRQVFYT